MEDFAGIGKEYAGRLKDAFPRWKHEGLSHYVERLFSRMPEGFIQAPTNLSDEDAHLWNKEVLKWLYRSLLENT